ncbi:Uncharacterized protein Fot_08273 [Forsythia ovata]|uniref:Uncharacterized protein n=1 Tax=Forsythia ovata TaxID=205694 RepID=A0ABD1WY69_9LAMI
MILMYLLKNMMIYQFIMKNQMRRRASYTRSRRSYPGNKRRRCRCLYRHLQPPLIGPSLKGFFDKIKKKGFLDKIKEKIPRYHPKIEEKNEKEKEKESACH